LGSYRQRGGAGAAIFNKKSPLKKVSFEMNFFFTSSFDRKRECQCTLKLEIDMQKEGSLVKLKTYLRHFAVAPHLSLARAFDPARYDKLTHIYSSKPTKNNRPKSHSPTNPTKSLSLLPDNIFGS